MEEIVAADRLGRHVGDPLDVARVHADPEQFHLLRRRPGGSRARPAGDDQERLIVARPGRDLAGLADLRQLPRGAEGVVEQLQALGIPAAHECELRAVGRPGGEVRILDDLQHPPILRAEDRQAQVLLEEGDGQIAAIGAPGERQAGQVRRPGVNLLIRARRQDSLAVGGFLEHDLEPGAAVILGDQPSEGQRLPVGAPGRRGQRPPRFLEQDRLPRIGPGRPDSIDGRHAATPPTRRLPSLATGRRRPVQPAGGQLRGTRADRDGIGDPPPVRRPEHRGVQAPEHQRHDQSEPVNRRARHFRMSRVDGEGRGGGQGAPGRDHRLRTRPRCRMVIIETPRLPRLPVDTKRSPLSDSAILQDRTNRQNRSSMHKNLTLPTAGLNYDERGEKDDCVESPGFDASCPERAWGLEWRAWHRNCRREPRI